MFVARRISTRACVFFLCCTAGAQQLPGRNQGGTDGDIPAPVVEQSSARNSDANALAEIQAYANAVGSALWQGMQASGTTVHADSPDPLPTTLSMLPDHRVRFVVSTPKGDNVTIINGSHGHVHYAGESIARLPAHTVAGGVAPFDLPGFVALHPDRFTVLDLGMSAIDGQQLHGVSIQADLANPDGGEGADKRSVIDFYFEPTTHLLKKSAVFVLLPGTGRHRFLRVLNYADYKTAGTALIPSRLSETMDGQPTWTLQLTAIDTTNLPSPTLF